MYELVMKCLMENVGLQWSKLKSYCKDDDAVIEAVNMCEFYGVAIHGHPSGHIRAKFIRVYA